MEVKLISEISPVAKGREIGGTEGYGLENWTVLKVLSVILGKIHSIHFRISVYLVDGILNTY